MKPPSRKDMVAAARAQYGDEGRIEVDDSARVSRAEGNHEGGAYVQAWVWVEDSDVKPGEADSTQR